MNDIKSRIKSVQSTMQITKAMELVATSKLRKAKERVERARPFYEVLSQAISDIESGSDVCSSAWSAKTEGNRTLYVVIAGDRGRAGGYNANIFRLTSALKNEGEESIYLPIGKKAYEYYQRRGVNTFVSEPLFVSEVGVGASISLAGAICDAFKEGKIDRVILVYTKFKSMISQVPVYEELLPLNKEGCCDDSKKRSAPIYEGEVEEILDRIVPDFIGGILYSAVCESLASESGARRSSMNAANKNAEEMIGSLMLKYNRARQAIITQEITEIVSGSEAL